MCRRNRCTRCRPRPKTPGAARFFHEERLSAPRRESARTGEFTPPGMYATPGEQFFGLRMGIMSAIVLAGTRSVGSTGHWPRRLRAANAFGANDRPRPTLLRATSLGAFPGRIELCRRCIDGSQVEGFHVVEFEMEPVAVNISAGKGRMVFFIKKRA